MLSKKNRVFSTEKNRTREKKLMQKKCKYKCVGAKRAPPYLSVGNPGPVATAALIGAGHHRRRSIPIDSDQ